MLRSLLYGYSVVALLWLPVACATGALSEPAPAPPLGATPAAEPVPILVSSTKTQPPASAATTGAASPIEAAVQAADRSADDRALDAQRKPAELLTFFGIAQGQRVAELGAGGGYTAELLARVVGPSGKVYGQNSKFVLERFAQ